MKRPRTSTFTKKPVSSPDAPYQDPRRHLSAAEKREVKQLISQSSPKGVVHNGPASPAPISGPLLSAPTAIVAFTSIAQGLSENQRRGDQVWIDKIKFRCLLTTTSISDHVRFLVVRQVRSGMPPLPVVPADILQNAGAGSSSIISFIQDDQPCEILHDEVVIVGDNTVNYGPRLYEFTLDFGKRPKQAIFLDGTAISGPATTVMGDIELICATRTAGTSMIYSYDVFFHEK